ncbi:MAG: sodium:proton exchanger [Armatimonadia bacterium]|nr:sodium:proton exchanger [Armatimonadia bacterium]
MHFDIANFLIVLFAAWLAGQVARRVGYPPVLGELIAGLLLGPPLLGLIHTSEALGVLAEVGVLLMMLYIGMEIHPDELFKASWPGVLAAFGGFITPFVGGYFVTIWFGGEPLAALFVGIAVGVTSLATKSRILVDLKLLGTRVAHVLMAGALFSDSAALVVFAGILGVVDVGALDAGTISVVAGKALLFFIVTAAVGWKLLPYVTNRMARAGLTNRTLNATLILMLALLFSYMAELAGLHAILGAFIAGLFLREGMLERRLFADINKLVHDMSIGFLAPIFFVIAGFEVTFDVFTTDLWLLIAILVVATVGKILGTALFYLPSGHGWREGITVGAGMNGRGAVEIIIAGIGLQMGIIDNTIFSILVFMAIFTTATVPLLLTWTVNWLRSRDELVVSGQARDGVLIIGAGPTARLLARRIGEKQPVWLVDANIDHCEAARDAGFHAVCSNAKTEESLALANAERAQALIAMTPNAETNIIASQIGFLVFDVPEIYVMIDEQITKGMGNILRDIGARDMCAFPVDIEEWDYLVSHEQAEVVEEEVTKQTSLGAFVDHFEGAMLPLIVRRQGEIAFPCSAAMIDAGDTVIALERARTLADSDSSQ